MPILLTLMYINVRCPNSLVPETCEHIGPEPEDSPSGFDPNMAPLLGSFSQTPLSCLWNIRTWCPWGKRQFCFTPGLKLWQTQKYPTSQFFGKSLVHRLPCPTLIALNEPEKPISRLSWQIGWLNVPRHQKNWGFFQISWWPAPKNSQP